MPPIAVWTALVAAGLPAGLDRSARLFDRVEPLLVGKCVSCHGPDKSKGGLRLDSRAALLQGGDSGPAVVPGAPDDSPLVQAVRGTRPDHPGDRMPPKDPLAPTEVTALAAWVRGGAAWPARAVAATAGRRGGTAWADPDNPVRKAFGGDRLDLWSFQPPARPPVPAVRRADWPRNPIDAFVLAKLEAKGLAPAPEADRRTLLRRLTFDLHGLPPTPDEVAAFAADGSPDAYDKLVDRLLASPRYGERWARHWLDVVRYADTHGFERDEFRPDMWRYRDYVVRSLNADKPYDRFVREQLAGDEMGPAGPVRDQADADRWIATGFLRLGPHDSTAALFEEDKRGRDDLLADLANTTASAFLGLTYSCCQCHHHKYDPLTQQDHYRLRAFFAAVKPRDDFAVDLPADRARKAAAAAALTRLTDERAARLAPAKAFVAGMRRAFLPAADRTLLAAADGSPSEANKKRRAKLLKQLAVADETAVRFLPPAGRDQVAGLDREIEAARGRREPPATAAVMTDGGKTAPAVFVNYQGDYSQPKDEVAPGVPSALDPNPAAGPPVPTATTGRRTALAVWLSRRDNPFPARVAVNRLWLHHFGKGLIATPNDLGFSGSRPTHPDLLDWLANELPDRGWGLKALHKLMVTSATYRQASAETPAGRAADPANTLVWRQNPRRLDAEALRDAVLAVSGRLRPDRGGPPRWPHVPEDVLMSSPAIYEARHGKADGRLQDYYEEPADTTDVRSLFLVQKRSVPYPFLQPFDLPDSAVSCGCRPTTTVAPQALALLNSPAAARLATAFADRVAADAGADPGARVGRAFRLALGRAPDPNEQRLGEKLLADYGLPSFCRAVFNLNEFAYVD